MLSVNIKTKFLQNFLLGTFVVSLCVPGKLRYDRGSFHFGGAEFAVVPFFVPLAIWLITLVLVNRASKIKIDAPTKVVLIFLVVQILLIPFAIQPIWSVLELARLLICVVVFMLFARNLHRESGLMALGVSIITIVALQSAAAVVQASTGVTVSGLDLQQSELNVVSVSSYRLVGTLGHPGTLAQFMTILFPMMVFSATRKNAGLIGLLALIAMPIIVIFTQSRTGIVVMVATIWVMIVVRSKSIKKIRLKLLFIAGSLLTMFAVVDVLWDTLVARFIQDPGESAETRELIAQTALNMIYARPVAGIGLNNFTEVMRSFDTSGITLTFPYPVHNIYLLIAAETGLVGLISFLLLNAYFAILAVRNMKNAQGSAFDSLSFFLLVSLGVIFVTGLLGWAWRQDSIQCLYWICLGGIAADYRNRIATGTGASH